MTNLIVNAVLITLLSALPFLPSGNSPLIPDNVMQAISVVFFMAFQIVNVVSYIHNKNK